MSDKGPGGGPFDVLIQTRMFFLKWLTKGEKIVNSLRNVYENGCGLVKRSQLHADKVKHK